MTTIRVPAEAFPPGEFLRDQLEARGWTQKDLAEILGRPVRLVNEIINSRRAVTLETARGLAEAFDTSPDYWINLETAYRWYKLAQEERSEPDGVVSRRARLRAAAPIKDMIKRGWLEHSGNVSIMEQQVLKFFNIGSITEQPSFRAAARKSTSYDGFTRAQLAWLFRAMQLAPAVQVFSAFSPRRIDSLVANLRPLLVSPADVRLVVRVMADHGVRFLVVEHLPSTKIDGACFWLDAKSPVVVLSLRYDRIDNFWHNLMHELGHVDARDGLDNDVPTLDVDLVGGLAVAGRELPEAEVLANAFAASALISQPALDDFINRVRPLYSHTKMSNFATRMQVHPGIVAGQLHHRKEIDFKHSRKMLEKVREQVIASTLTDGWGHIAPTMR